MIRQAFNVLTRLHSTAAILRRPSTPPIETEIRVTPANYFRFLEGPSHSIIKGREFIIPVSTIREPLPNGIKRGDRIVHPVFGAMAIDEIMDIYDIGGAVMGYRCRVE